MPRFHAAINQSLPDQGQLIHPGAEQVDPLTAGDLGVEAEVLCDLADQNQVFWLDVTARHPRHHRVTAVLLDVGQEVVVGIL
ncbi:Uncharacterised protein [Mycobacterium tuberculosis]|uniref:Uncharacterized protein n=1 Tax=Mycobacterium tuberculosis TaxID=1773 RepID=A0A916P8D7_MYCTX|nr:Uncharacterised protein [Mycobacterium tuberculosis]